MDSVVSDSVQIWLTPSTSYWGDLAAVRLKVLCRGGYVVGSGGGFVLWWWCSGGL